MIILTARYVILANYYIKWVIKIDQRKNTFRSYSLVIHIIAHIISTIAPAPFPLTALLLIKSISKG